MSEVASATDESDLSDVQDEHVAAASSVNDYALRLLNDCRTTALYGTAEYYELCTFPEGPATAAELADWPMLQLRQLSASTKGGCRLTRLESLYGAKLAVHTDYSGMGGPETVLRMQNIAMCSAGYSVK